MKIVIAGGGTGGHLFPGIAIAQTLKAEYDAEVLFVGTEKGIESREVPKAGFDLEVIEVAGLKRVGPLQFLKSLVAIPRALLQSGKILRRFGATAVIGVGGYASGPLVLMAAILGIPTAICEQNSVPGLTNKILSKFVKRIFCSFEKSKEYFPARKCEMAGNPVRQSFLSATSETQHGLIFTFGGSQGAQILNDNVPAALGLIKSRGHSITAIHQTGRSGLEQVQAAYHNADVTADVTPFIDKMAEIYLKADLVICRAGATSCAELTALGVPAILIPFPFAADDHQRHNALDLAHSGAALILEQTDLTPERLADQIEALLTERPRRDAIAKSAKKKGRPDASAVIAHSAAQGFSNRNSLVSPDSRDWAST
jgi:UDP-N-acetylglucosamine--N-acetylmuramyl-(pentapeptide) pyrophosphoryl-undecaprenol N-acetylglucosamine transferase